MKINILDIGCGASKLLGSVGMDCLSLDGVDIVHNLDNFPWPIESNSVNKSYLVHSISHLSDIKKTMIELYRITAPGGEVEIVAPHFSSDNFFTDPTHKFSLGIRSMDYFCKNGKLSYRYIKSEVQFELIFSRISFRESNIPHRKSKKLNFMSLIGIEFLVSKFPRIYEKFISNFLPASEVHFCLKKL